MARILLLTTDLEIGGTPTVVRELAWRLKRAMSYSGSSDLHVACLGGWGPVAEEIRERGGEVVALGARSIGDIGVIKRLLKLLRERRIDTVLSFLLHANAAAAVASVFATEIRWIQSIQTTQQWPRWHWWVQAVAQYAAGRVIVPSWSVAEVAARWSAVPRGKIEVIPNAVDLAEYAECWDCNRAGADSEHRRGNVVFIGRLDPIKSIPDLLAAVKLLAGRVHLQIHGEGEQRAELAREIVKLGIERMATLCGAIARPQEALQKAGILVLPSEAEGFGLVLIEAMAAGVPVVQPQTASFPELIEATGGGVLCEPGDAKALAEAIESLLLDPTRSRALGEAGRKAVAENFTVARLAQESLRVFQS